MDSHLTFEIPELLPSFSCQNIFVFGSNGLKSGSQNDMFLRAVWEACQMLPPADCPQEVYSIMQQCLQYDVFIDN